MTFTPEDIITLAAVVGAILALYAIIAKPLKLLYQINRVTTFTAGAVKLQSDMISILFDNAIAPKTADELTKIKADYDKANRDLMFDKIMKNDDDKIA